ncbi:MAG: helix-hairpin-helix domain-containing protein [Bacteroidetes bacterium]|nr:helix-hairpin-helix domain-containing protein [Bacteroidota bacterium]
MRPFGNDHFSSRIFRGWLLQYSRAEKRGISLLLLLIILLWVLPGILHQTIPPPALNLVLHGDEADSAQSPATDPQADYDDAAPPKQRTFHMFDPNTAGAEELLGLGFNRRCVRSMLRYREKGGVFRKKEDLFRIWGIDSNLVKDLLPYIREHQSSIEQRYPGQVSDFKPPKQSKPEPFRVDVNSADSFTLQRLPGIGPKLAARIVAYREKLGGFHSLTQMNEVFGLNQETLNRLNEDGLWYLGRGVYRKIMVNRADAINLRHPYISRKQAGILEAYRKQHGLFSDSSAMFGILSFSAEELRRLFPYLDFSR